MYIQYMQDLVSPGSVQQIMLHPCSLHCNSSLNTWTVVRLTATKLKPLKFSTSEFILPYVVDIIISIILYVLLLNDEYHTENKKTLSSKDIETARWAHKPTNTKLKKTRSHTCLKN
jgi:hypothetical protein